MPTHVYINFMEGKGISSVEPPPEKPELQKVPTEVSDINEVHEEKSEKKKHYDDDKRLLLKNGGFNDADIKAMEKRDFEEE